MFNICATRYRNALFVSCDMHHMIQLLFITVGARSAPTPSPWRGRDVYIISMGEGCGETPATGGQCPH